MRLHVVASTMAVAACGRVGFDAIDAAVDAGSTLGDGPGLACVATTGVDWASSTIPNEPDAGLPNTSRYMYDATIVYDEVSGLIWQRGPAGPFTQAQAAAYCDGLSLGGCDQWRLPMRVELTTIVDHRYANTAVIDPVAFPATPPDFFWTATPQTGSANNSWIVNFTNGNSFWDVNTNAFWVRCVRATRSTIPPPDRYELTAEAVLDTFTRLTWQRVPSGSTYSVSEAATYCSGLAGGSWRVPSIRELSSIIDVTANPTIDPTAFAGTPAFDFWSSTPLDSIDPGPFMQISFEFGTTNNTDASTADYVRCVR